MTEDNNPEIILKLVARSHRACIAWVDPHNESFYLPPLLEVTNKDLQEAVVHPDGTSRQPTPSSEDVMASEPALQINFRKKPKNPEKGYVLGSDRKSCDILLGEVDDCISNQMFILSFNQYNDVVMKSSAKNATMVRYDTKIDSQIDTQIAKRTNFTWIFPPGQEKLSVRIARTIEFSVEVPIHETDKIAYETNCRNFMVQAKSAMVTMNRLDLSSRPETNLASGMKSPHATAEPPFYLRTEKIGKGGFGMVYRARSMPSGETVALKTFKSKNAWTLEIDVLRKLFKTPHVSSASSFARFQLTHKLGQHRQIHRLRDGGQAFLSYGACSRRNLGTTTQIYAIHHPRNCAHSPPDVGGPCLSPRRLRHYTPGYQTGEHPM